MNNRWLPISFTACPTHVTHATLPTQLAMNFCWTPIFFTAHRPAAAAVESAATLGVAAAATVAMSKVWMDTLSGTCIWGKALACVRLQRASTCTACWVPLLLTCRTWPCNSQLQHLEAASQHSNQIELQPGDQSDTDVPSHTCHPLQHTHTQIYANVSWTCT
eukprot:364040-Chlamydomonas_euryale.AAC.1